MSDRLSRHHNYYIKKNSVVFLAARISYIRFFTAVQIYEFHISKSLFITGMVYLDPIELVSSVGRALH